MLSIKVLGAGCPNCQKVEENARQAVTMLGTEAKIEKITDRAEFQKYNLLVTPGLVINEKLVSAGRIPSESEMMTWVADALV
jgi:small redox-active disulfide protein 2